MDETKLIKLQHFFEADMKLKKEMYQSAPPAPDKLVDVEKYADSLYESLLYIFSELKCVSLDLYGPNSTVLKKCLELEKDIKQAFYNCGYDYKKLQAFYTNYISNMDPNFINKVKENCMGYYLWAKAPFDEAKTINEFLHVMHAFIVNNDHIYKSIPEVCNKKNDQGYPISYRGVDTPAFKTLFENFPLDLDVGWTDMLCLDDRKVLMMIRDRGHALTLEITLNPNNEARVEYFIPKICNLDMVNSLEGVNKVDNDVVGTTGVIVCNINDLPNKVFTFISMVPTDVDMPFHRS